MNEFVYLGYRFNIKTFDVTPEISKISVRYLTNLSRPEIAKSLAYVYQIFPQKINQIKSFN